MKPTTKRQLPQVSLQTSCSAAGCFLRWEFMPEVLSVTSVRLLNRHLLAMAQRLVAEGAQIPVAHLAAAPWDQRDAIHNWSLSQSPPLPESRVEDLFIQQARRSPSQSAVMLGEERLSYGQLLEASRSFAEVLMSHRTADPLVVAILSDRCLELPMALLSVLMAGGSFVPLSPEFPKERLQWMVTEARAQLVAATEALSDLGSLGLPLQVIPSIGKMDSSGTQRMLKSTKPNLVAYVIFTSGSTGKPKGVALSHRALLSHLMPYIRVLRLGSQDRVLLTSSFTFDMAYSQIFGALLSGACLVLTTENPMIDPLELLEILQKETISFTTLVPSVLSSMVHLKKMPFSLPALRHLGCGGEALKTATADFLRSCTSAVRTPLFLHNRYGPTECAINALLFGPTGVTGAMPNPEMDFWQEDVPIGWPSGHRHIAIDCTRMDGHGELILAGLGLALGYVSRSQKSSCDGSDGSASFQANLRGAGRQYRTGDLACRIFRKRPGPQAMPSGQEHANGCVRFIGRRDSQVKLQGQRIELSEIEETICKLPEVDACVVVHVTGNHSGSLVAFISSASDVRETVRSQCEKFLPRAMIPQIQLLKMTSWPRTSSAKIDRAALVDMVSPLSPSGSEDPSASAVGILLEAHRHKSHLPIPCLEYHAGII